MPRRPPAGRWTRVVWRATASLAVAAGLVAGVGISVAAAKTKHGPVRQCAAVSDVLSDGPTVTADPVGYAEAQILPLQRLKLPDRTLRRAVQQLDTAYKAFSNRDGSAKAAPRMTAAEARVDAICPNAAP